MCRIHNALRIISYSEFIKYKGKQYFGYKFIMAKKAASDAQQKAKSLKKRGRSCLKKNKCLIFWIYSAILKFNSVQKSLKTGEELYAQLNKRNYDSNVQYSRHH